MVMQAIQIVHALPGRVRVKLPRLKGNTTLAREIGRTLTPLEGIHHVETSTTTGSVLVLYEPRLLSTLDTEAVGSLSALADMLGLSVEDVPMAELQRRLHAATNGAHAGMSTTLGSGIAALLGSVNAGVIPLTGGWGELRTLVPLTLAFLGLRSLLLTDRLPFPSWYEYLWFAFSTFVALHPSRSSSEVHPAM